MYHEIKQLLRQEHSFSSVAQITGIDRRTVKKYDSMSEAEYTAFLENKESRTRLLIACIYRSMVTPHSDLWYPPFRSMVNPLVWQIFYR